MAESAITFASGEVSIYYAARVPYLKQRRASEWRGPCPIHHGKDANFAVVPATGLWYCHSQCGRGGDLLDFEMSMTGADFKAALAAVHAILGRPMPARARMTSQEWRAAREAGEREERDRCEAGYFAGAAILLLEGELERLPDDSSERRTSTHILDTLQADPLTIYRLYRASDEKSAAAWVRAGREHERRVHLSLAELILKMASEETNDEA